MATSAQPPHILVINDAQEILDLLRDLLEEEGYRVSLHSSAVHDLATIKALAPDLIILDHLIGQEAHGWTLLQKLKLDRETAALPVILCTAALGTVREIEGHLRQMEVRVVLKPFDIDVLLEAVAQALTRTAGDAATGEGEQTR